MEQSNSDLSLEAFNYPAVDHCELFALRVTNDLESLRLPIVLLHGGGPDHHSVLPLASRLTDLAEVLLPDIRGYGRSVCTDPTAHTWSQYAQDIVTLLDHQGIPSAVVGGAGIGGTIALRAALEHPDRVRAVVVISLEDIEDEAAKAAEIRFMDEFAERVQSSGIEAAWEPILPTLPPVISSMVKDAIPRSTPASIAAAAAIGRDRAFGSPAELARIAVPALLFAGIDWRHPAAIAEEAVRCMPHARLGKISMSAELTNDQDFADAFAPEIRKFLLTLDD